ncbi:MAG: hypothetical protein WBP81_09875, partial [Solirubrobacteraceae bacterium]
MSASPGTASFCAHDHARDVAAGIWVIAPAFVLDLVHEQLNDADATPAREEAYLAGARINDDELRDATADDEARRAQAHRGRRPAARRAQADRLPPAD